MDQALPQLQIGDLLDGRYRLQQQLGSGGVGYVQGAIDEQTNERVAVKFLRAELLHDERQLHRFLREFRAISRLNHPNCLKVYAEGDHQGLHYFVMEFVEGGDLEQVAKLTNLEKLATLLQIASALHYIHSLRIIHRDLKPGNILIINNQQDFPVPKLADFGLAKVGDSNPNSKSAVTQVGEMIGTVAYMSPEQIRGEAVDPRTDLYALGCILYFLWTGYPPFKDKTLFYEAICAHLDSTPPPLEEVAPDVPPEVAQLARQLLSKDPAKRPQNAGELTEFFQKALLREEGGQALLQKIQAGQHPPKPETSTFLYKPPLLGREQEINWLHKAAESIFLRQTQRAPVIALTGAAGIGKTHLMDALRADFMEHGIHVVNINVPQDFVAPFAPFPEIEEAVEKTLEDIRNITQTKPDLFNLVQNQPDLTISKRDDSASPSTTPSHQDFDKTDLNLNTSHAIEKLKSIPRATPSARTSAIAAKQQSRSIDPAIATTDFALEALGNKEPDAFEDGEATKALSLEAINAMNQAYEQQKGAVPHATIVAQEGVDPGEETFVPPAYTSQAEDAGEQTFIHAPSLEQAVATDAFLSSHPDEDEDEGDQTLIPTSYRSPHATIIAQEDVDPGEETFVPLAYTAPTSKEETLGVDQQAEPDPLDDEDEGDQTLIPSASPLLLHQSLDAQGNLTSSENKAQQIDLKATAPDLQFAQTAYGLDLSNAPFMQTKEDTPQGEDDDEAGTTEEAVLLPNDLTPETPDAETPDAETPPFSETDAPQETPEPPTFTAESLDEPASPQAPAAERPKDPDEDTPDEAPPLTTNAQADDEAPQPPSTSQEEHTTPPSASASKALDDLLPSFSSDLLSDLSGELPTGGLLPELSSALDSVDDLLSDLKKPSPAAPTETEPETSDATPDEPAASDATPDATPDDAVAPDATPSDAVASDATPSDAAASSTEAQEQEGTDDSAQSTQATETPLPSPQTEDPIAPKQPNPEAMKTAIGANLAVKVVDPQDLIDLDSTEPPALLVATPSHQELPSQAPAEQAFTQESLPQPTASDLPEATPTPEEAAAAFRLPPQARENPTPSNDKLIQPELPAAFSSDELAAVESPAHAETADLPSLQSKRDKDDPASTVMMDPEHFLHLHQDAPSQESANHAIAQPAQQWGEDPSMMPTGEMRLDKLHAPTAQAQDWDDPAFLPTSRLGPELLAELNNSVELNLEQLANPQQTAPPSTSTITPEIIERFVNTQSRESEAFTYHEHNSSKQDPGAQRRYRASQLARKLAYISSRTHFSIFIEDFHHAEPGAFAFLYDVLINLPRDGSHQPCIVLTLRSGNGREKLAKFATRLNGFYFLDLQPLQHEAIRDMVSSMLGIRLEEAHKHPDIQLLTQRLLEETEGNPFFIRSYLETLVEEKKLTKHDDQWKLTEAIEISNSLPRTIDEIMQERLKRLSPEVKKTLQIAAVIGREFEYTLLHQLSGLTRDRLLDVLEESLRIGVIHSLESASNQDLYAFVHRRTVEALYESIPPHNRRAYHDTIATFLEQRPSPPYAVVSYHFGRGNDLQRALQYLKTAGEEALRINDHEAAASHFQTALERFNDLSLSQTQDLPHNQKSLSTQLKHGLAEAYLGLGQAQQATPLLQELIERVQDPIEQARYYRKLARSLLLDHDTERSIEAFHNALETLGDKAPTGRFSLRWRANWDSFLRKWSSSQKEAQELDPKEEQLALTHKELSSLLRWIHGQRAHTHHLAFLRIAERLGHPTFLIDAYADHILDPSVIQDKSKVEQLSARIQELLQEQPNPPGATIYHANLGRALLYQSDMTNALSNLQSSVQIAHQFGDRFLLGEALIQWGWSRNFFGQWQEAQKDFQYTLNLAEELHDPRLRISANSGLAFIMLMNHQLPDAQSLSQTLLEESTRIQLPAYQCLARQLLAGSFFFQRKFHKAVELLEETIQQIIDTELLDQYGDTLLFNHTEAMLWLHDIEGKHAIPDLIPKLKRNIKLTKSLHPFPLFQGFHTVLQGILYSRQGRTKSAQKSFQQALEVRSSLKKHYFSGWLMQRMALELAYLNDSESIIQTLLKKSEESYHHTHTLSLQEWGRWIRQHLNLS